jgi:hypothetical protein
MPQAEAGGIGPAGSQFQHKLPSLDLIHRARDGLNWSRLSEQKFRVDKWSLCRG